MIKLIVLILLGSVLLSCSHTVGVNNQVVLLDTLYQRHEQWQGTPYKLGGYDQDGIDCSGFVALTFAEEFGIDLPRSTRQQAQLGSTVPRSMLQTGDLVFFKIPEQGKVYHVGIYLENKQFLHASTSQGVMISSLQALYWQSNYWKAIRAVD